MEPAAARLGHQQPAMVMHGMPYRRSFAWNMHHWTMATKVRKPLSQTHPFCFRCKAVSQSGAKKHELQPVPAWCL